MSATSKSLVAVAAALLLGRAVQGQDVRVLNGHFASVRSVAFSPDGNSLATSGYDNTARIWDLKTGNQVRSMAHPNWATHVAFSPDGKLLGTACWDRGVRLWDPTTGANVRTFFNHPSAAYQFAFSPDGKVVASVAAERNLRIWDSATTRELRTALADNFGNVYAVAFSPDGRTIATGGQDRIIRLWDATTGTELKQLSGHGDVVVALTFSPDGRMLVSGSHDRTVRLWELSTGRARLQLNGHANLVRAVAISGDGRTIASGSYDNTVRLWDALNGKELKQLVGHTSFVWAVNFSPDGKTLASGSEDRSARVWKVSEFTERKGGKVEALTAKEAASRWADLTSDDGAKAYKAVADLAASPTEALAHFKEVLRPVRELNDETHKRVVALLAELDDADFATRKKAMTALSALGPPVAPQLRKALAAAEDVDLRLRLMVVLRTMDTTGMSPEQMRILRALEALERMGGAEARDFVRELSRGLPDAFLTKEARASLARMERGAKKG